MYLPHAAGGPAPVGSAGPDDGGGERGWNVERAGRADLRAVRSAEDALELSREDVAAGSGGGSGARGAARAAQPDSWGRIDGPVGWPSASLKINGPVCRPTGFRRGQSGRGSASPTSQLSPGVAAGERRGPTVGPGDGSDGPRRKKIIPREA